MDNLEKYLALVIEAENAVNKALSAVESIPYEEAKEASRSQYDLRRALEETLTAKRRLERSLNT